MKKVGRLAGRDPPKKRFHLMICLIDCNNFFASCERLFRPDLLGKPLLVLSSNDGCAIARSNEAKALRIAMGAPIFKLRNQFHIVDAAHHCATNAPNTVYMLSANFELYGDISRRIISLITEITPAIEVYSIDEAFLDLSQLDVIDYTAWGKEVRDRIAKEIGMPVSVGIAPSKTLAKLANDRAKKLPELNGVLYLDEHNSAPFMQNTPVRNVWGVGRKFAPKLLAEGISTAYDLAHMRPKFAQQLMGINGRIMASELLGTRCLPLQRTHKPQQMIMRGRQFGQDTDSIEIIEAAMTSLATRACLQLRRENRLACKAYVLIHTNWHKPGYRKVVGEVQLREPTADTGTISSQLAAQLRKVFVPNLPYHRADVLLLDLIHPAQVQLDLFGQVQPQTVDIQAERMEAIDAINNRYQKTTLGYAAEHLSDAWQPRKRHGTPRYTSAWSDIPVATIQATDENSRDG